MISNWIKAWLRHLVRFRQYALINVTGLSFGIAAVVTIYLYISDELSFDRFQLNGERIYRVSYTSRYSETENIYPTTPATLGEAVRTDLIDVQQVVRLYSRQAGITVAPGESGEKKFREDFFYLADPSVFEVFTFQFLAGAPQTALQNPNQLVINRRLAMKYFGAIENAVGKNVLFEGQVPLTVSAVVEDLPEQASERMELIAHFDNFYSGETPETQDYLRRDWVYNPVSTYVLLKPGVDAADVQTAMNGLKKKYADERVINNVTYQLQPLFDIHLRSSFSFFGASENIRYVYILGSIGLLILVIGCSNFVNLANAQSLKRAREIGVRKVMGAERRSLILQFVLEASALVLVSFVVALIILYLALPFVNEVSGKHFEATGLLTFKLFGGFVVLFVITAILAGAYPSFYITRFNPVKVLKGFSSGKTSEGYVVRKFLVVGQFSISAILVVIAVVLYQQMQFVKNKPLGFQRELMLTIPLFSNSPNAILGGGVDGSLRARMNAFENELISSAAAEAITVSSALPGQGAVSALVSTDQITEEQNVFVNSTAVDYDFIESYNMEIVAGRGFSREFGTDHLQAFVINEQAVKALGWETPDEAIGQRISIVGKDGSVVGVVKDFHFQGLQQPLRPLVLEVAAGKFTVFTARLVPGRSLPDAIAGVKFIWDKTFPEKVFEYHFLDERLEANYGTENRLTTMVEYFSILAVFISALGLFGLSAHVNHTRAREVGIRKVLGAHAGQIFYVLTKEFLILVIIALVIALPVSFVLASQWLDSFAYRMVIGLLPFAAGAAVALSTVILSISYETIRSTRSDPVKVLRVE
jgi:putative ABC transport system permease protein